MEILKFQVFTKDSTNIYKCFDVKFFELLPNQQYNVYFLNSVGQIEHQVVDRQHIRMFVDVLDIDKKEIYERDIVETLEENPRRFYIFWDDIGKTFLFLPLTEEGIPKPLNYYELMREIDYKNFQYIGNEFETPHLYI